MAAARITLVVLAAAALLAGGLLVVLRDDAPVELPAIATAPSPTSSEPAPRASSGDERPRARVLSDERTFSRWAFVKRGVAARRQPGSDSPRAARVSAETEDRTPEVVLALEETEEPRAKRWVRVRLPSRSADTGWVPRSALGRYHRVTTMLEIDLGAMRAILYDEGAPVWRARVGIGTERNPTPAGNYYVRSRIVPTDPEGVYGTFALGTSAYSPGLSDWPNGGVVGIHGTDQPEILPGAVSHGCIRLPNREIAHLRRTVSLGTPVKIS